MDNFKLHTWQADQDYHCAELEKRHKKSHKNVLNNSKAARVALHKLLISLNFIDNNTPFHEWEIVSHLYLKKFPHLLVSLAHTEGVGAAYVKKATSLSSVGIDIEKLGRKICDGSHKFFMSQVKIKEPDPLTCWVIKEACFKAIAPIKLPFFHKKLVLNDIWIDQRSFGLENKTLGQFTCRKENGLIIAMADFKNI